jgi:hypothetical protein
MTKTTLQDGVTYLNVGLARPLGGYNSRVQVLDLVRGLGITVLKSRVVQSDSELTVVLELADTLTEGDALLLCHDLGQEAIAQFAGGRGELLGPAADQWLPFNAHYFFLPCGNRLSEIG